MFGEKGLGFVVTTGMAECFRAACVGFLIVWEGFAEFGPCFCGGGKITVIIMK